MREKYMSNCPRKGSVRARGEVLLEKTMRQPLYACNCAVKTSGFQQFFRISWWMTTAEARCLSLSSSLHRERGRERANGDVIKAYFSKCFLNSRLLPRYFS